MAEGSLLGVEGGDDSFVTPESGSKLSPNAEIEDQVMEDVDPAAPTINGNGHREVHQSSLPANKPASNLKESFPTPLEQARGLTNGTYTPKLNPPSVRNSLPSPGQPTTTNSIKLDKNVALFNELLLNTSTAAAQKFLREQWRALLFQDAQDEHVIFVLKAGLKNITPSVIDKLLKDGGRFTEALLKKASSTVAVTNAIVEEVLNHATYKQVLDHVPKLVFKQLESTFAQSKQGIPPQTSVQAAKQFSPQEIDALILDRLKIMPAISIVNLMAKANRLGFQQDDIIDPVDESVTPNIQGQDIFMNVPPQPPPTTSPTQLYGLAPPDRDPLLAEQERNLAAQQRNGFPWRDKAPRTADPGGYNCPHCGHDFGINLSGFNYHVHQKVCQRHEDPMKPWVSYCNSCAKGFVGKQGLEYHQKKEVCQGQDIARATSPSTQLRQEATANIHAPSMTSQQNQHHPGFQSPHMMSSSSQIARDPRRQSNQSHNDFTALGHQLPPAVFEEKKSRNYSPRQKYGSRGPYGARKTSYLDPGTAPQQPRSQPVNQPSQPPQPSQRAQVSGRHSFPSELNAETKAQLDQALEAAERRYQQHIANINASLTPEEREKKLLSLKNNHATKKSTIRRSFGVTLRKRALKRDSNTEDDASPAVHPEIEAFRAAPGSAPGNGSSESQAMGPLRHSSPIVPVTSGFSPINFPRKASKETPNHNGQATPYNHQHPLPTYYQPAAGPSGHVMQKDVRYQQHVIPDSNAQSQNNKRRRTDEGSRDGSSADAQFGMKVAGAEVDNNKTRNSEATLSKNNNIQVIIPLIQQDTPMTDAPATASATRTTGHEVVSISSSEDEDEDKPMESTAVKHGRSVEQSSGGDDEVLPSVEHPDDMEREEVQEVEDEIETRSQGSPSRRGGIMAKRGGGGRGRGRNRF